MSASPRSVQAPTNDCRGEGWRLALYRCRTTGTSSARRSYLRVQLAPKHCISGTYMGPLPKFPPSTCSHHASPDTATPVCLPRALPVHQRPSTTPPDDTQACVTTSKGASRYSTDLVTQKARPSRVTRTKIALLTPIAAVRSAPIRNLNVNHRPERKRLGDKLSSSSRRLLII